METPNPEKNKRIVNDAINILRERKPDAVTPPPKSDVEQVMDRIEATYRKIDAFVRPIADLERDKGTKLDLQKKMLMATLHKFWLDELMQYNEDEVRFLCALVHAGEMCNRYL